jgi:hypothetical protein
MKKILIALLAAVTAVSVWAQEPKVIGKIVNVAGLVTVTRGDSLVNATNDAPLMADSRIVTTGSGKATLQFDNGCDITLENNQSITVKDGQTCTALWAAVNSNGAQVATAVAAGSSNLVPGLILVAGAIGVIITSNNKNKSSGS